MIHPSIVLVKKCHASPPKRPKLPNRCIQDLAREPWRTEGHPSKRIKIKPYKEPTGHTVWGVVRTGVLSVRSSGFFRQRGFMILPRQKMVKSHFLFHPKREKTQSHLHPLETEKSAPSPFPGLALVVLCSQSDELGLRIFLAPWGRRCGPNCGTSGGCFLKCWYPQNTPKWSF